MSSLHDPNTTFHFTFSGDLEITMEFLVEIDKLVQLIESPIFACMLHLATPSYGTPIISNSHSAFQPFA